MSNDAPKKGGKIDQRVSAVVQKKLETLARVTGSSQAELLSEMILATSAYVAGRSGPWWPFKVVFDAEAAATMHAERERQMAILREPDPERQRLMIFGALPIPTEYFQRGQREGAELNESGRPDPAEEVMKKSLGKKTTGKPRPDAGAKE